MPFITDIVPIIGRIYCITSDMTDKVYVGSTTLSLEKRFSIHKKDKKRYDAGRYDFVSSFEILAFPDARIELLAAVFEGEDLKKVEQDFITSMVNTVNRIRSAPRAAVHHCHVCDCDIKLGKNSKGSYFPANIRQHERTKKHQTNLAKLQLN